MNVTQNPYACAFCQESYATAKDLVYHVQINHKPIKSLEFKTRSEKSDKRNVIDECLNRTLSDEDKETSQSNRIIESIGVAEGS